MFNLYNCCYDNLEKYFKLLTKYESRVFLDEDIEDVHEMRVSVRRLRASLRLFKFCIPQKLYTPLWKRLKLLAKTLGYVRDLDVFIEYLTEYENNHPENKAIVELLSVLKKKRKASYKQLIDFLNTKNPNKIKEGIQKIMAYELQRKGKKIKKPVKTGFFYSLAFTIDELFGYKNEIDVKNSKTTLHEIRIAIKHLRYNLEAINLDGEEAQNIVQILKSCQGELGKINDYNVMGLYLKEYKESHTLKVTQKAHLEKIIDHYENLLNTSIETVKLPWDLISEDKLKDIYLIKLKDEMIEQS